MPHRRPPRLETSLYRGPQRISFTMCIPHSDLEKCAAMFRQRTGYAHHQTHKNRLWQDGYYDHILREEEITLVVAVHRRESSSRRPLRGRPTLPVVGSSRYSIDQLADAVMSQ